MLTIDADAGAKGELERVEKLEAAANNDTESFDNNMITAEPSQEVSNETAPVRATNDVVPEQDEVVGQASPEDAMPVDTIGTVAQEFVPVQTNHSPLGINKGIATDQDTNGNTAEKEEANGANTEIKETEKDRNENGLVAEKGEDGAIEQNPGDSRDMEGSGGLKDAGSIAEVVPKDEDAEGTGDVYGNGDFNPDGGSNIDSREDSADGGDNNSGDERGGDDIARDDGGEDGEDVGDNHVGNGNPGDDGATDDDEGAGEEVDEDWMAEEANSEVGDEFFQLDDKPSQNPGQNCSTAADEPDVHPDLAKFNEDAENLRKQISRRNNVSQGDGQGKSQHTFMSASTPSHGTALSSSPTTLPTPKCPFPEVDECSTQGSVRNGSPNTASGGTFITGGQYDLAADHDLDDLTALGQLSEEEFELARQAQADNDTEAARRNAENQEIENELAEMTMHESKAPATGSDQDTQEDKSKDNSTSTTEQQTHHSATSDHDRASSEEAKGDFEAEPTDGRQDKQAGPSSNELTSTTERRRSEGD